MRNIIKARLQINGFYNINKGNLMNIRKTVDENEWQINVVIRT